MKLKKKELGALFSAIFMIGLLIFYPTETMEFLASSAPDKTTKPEQIAPTGELFPVSKVRDGDTFEVMIDGQSEAVRIVGINTPETVDPRRPVECFGKEASAQLSSMLEGKSVLLESDKTQSNRDRYGRLLRFVFVDGQDVGLKLLQEGFAEETQYGSQPHKYAESYQAAEKLAQQSNKGLWSDTACLP